ncbi:hypothetical protein EJ03DRAFT_32224 [Teratosphaeria nubilosa]|uniref:Uncharacterized protein n=1 Tax=Teratosphaeria nubilosa TaxID=161662 RepID=A0A6G1KVT8_9PEZI|nr:hypothetical protein EJ03DRAFT_32224 [Teratosphaeria nubilosa]
MGIGKGQKHLHLYAIYTHFKSCLIQFFRRLRPARCSSDSAGYSESCCTARSSSRAACRPCHSLDRSPDGSHSYRAAAGHTERNSRILLRWSPGCDGAPRPGMVLVPGDAPGIRAARCRPHVECARKCMIRRWRRRRQRARYKVRRLPRDSC